MASEAKHERFVRVAEMRTNRILDQIRVLGNCANLNNYEYSDAEVEKIFAAINDELNKTRLKFDRQRTTVEKFHLS